MRRHASSILLLNYLHNYLKAIKKTFVRHTKASLIYIIAVWRKSNKQNYIIILHISFSKLLIYNFFFYSI